MKCVSLVSGLTIWAVFSLLLVGRYYTLHLFLQAPGRHCRLGEESQQRSVSRAGVQGNVPLSRLRYLLHADDVTTQVSSSRAAPACAQPTSSLVLGDDDSEAAWHGGMTCEVEEGGWKCSGGVWMGSSRAVERGGEWLDCTP